MAFPKINDVRALSDEELQDAIVETKRKLFDLRFQKATRQLESIHEFKHMRHRLAQLLTVESERSPSTSSTKDEGAGLIEAVETVQDASPEQEEGGEV
jgi:large subunit ribosomal protein L29